MISSCATWRYRSLALSLSLRKHITTKSTTFADIKHELLSRPLITYHDHLNPQNLQMLSISLPCLDPIKHNYYARLLCPGSHAVLAQGHHLVFFPPTHPTGALLPDGTDQDHSPGLPFTRRLWAGGSVSFSQGWNSKLRIASQPWICRESIANVRLKGVPDETGFKMVPGPRDKILVDVERRYDLQEANDAVIVERRTLCFMSPKTSDDIKKALEQPVGKMIKGQCHSLLPHCHAVFSTTSPKTNQDIPAPKLLPKDSPTSYSHSFTLSPAMLFRFSALTFNAHKIHLDPQHCREVEGYRDLLVHGPLLLMLMLSVLNNRGHIVVSLDYKNLAPVYVGEEIRVCVQQRKDKWSVWIMGPQDDLRVKAAAVLDRNA